MSSPFPILVDTQLTTDTSIYASGDVLVATTAIPIPAGDKTPVGPVKFKVNSIELIDSSAQSGALDIVFLDQNKSFGALNAVAAISAADAKTVVHIESVTSYVSLGANASAASVVPYNGVQMQTAAGDTNIYVALIARAAKTYSATAL